MRKWKANSYVLSVCVLISEYVRQQQQDARQGGVGEDSVVSLVDAPHAQTPPATLSRPALNALARFLCQEIQHPLAGTTLNGLLRRLEISLDSEKDFEQLSWQLVDILTKIESPDAVWNTVEQIAECVEPLQSARDEEEELVVDSASATLVRTSLLGVFVRSFLLAVNRLLFDGLSRLFDDVQQYLEQFREDMATEKKLDTEQEEETKDSSLELLASPSMAAQHLWNESNVEDDELLLSPIHSASGTPSHPAPPASSLMTPAPTKAGSQSLTGQLPAPEAVGEENDPAAWSNDQLNYVLSDMVKDLEGGRSNGPRASLRAQSSEEPSTEEQRRLLRDKMDTSNPNVLFVRYLSFLRSRDYQGALDSLHQYHDVLSPRQDRRSGGSDAASSEATGAAGLHFRGSGIQYAALNLAGLQIIFDHQSAAQESLQEAIRVAQHHGDHICVAFALAWLVRVNQKTGKAKDAVLQLVGSCLDRAQELRLPALQVLATLTAVETDLMRGSADRPASVGSAPQFVSHVFAAHTPAPRPLHIWARLHDTMQAIATIATPPASVSNSGTRTMNALQAQAGMGAASSDRSGGSGMAWLKSAEAVLDTVWKLGGKVSIAAAAGWGLFGQRSLASVFARIHLLCYEDSASTGEVALTVSQMALSSLALAEEGGCVYARALEFLVDVVAGGDGAPKRQHLLAAAAFQRTLHVLFFLWALDRGEVARADVHLSAVLVLSPEGKDFVAYLEALALKARLWKAMGDYTRSLELLERLEATCSERGFAYLQAQVLIAISRTRFQAAAPHAPFASLSTLLRGVGICRGHHYDLLLAEAHVVMADTYVAMGKLQDAHALVSDQMPLVMEHGSIGLRGECLLVLAKTTLASVKRSKDGAKELGTAASKTIELLDASANMFSLVQSVHRLQEVSYVKSLVYNHAASQAEKGGSDSSSFCSSREQAAASFLARSSQLKQAPFLPVEPFFDLESPDGIRRAVIHRSSEL